MCEWKRAFLYSVQIYLCAWIDSGTDLEPFVHFALLEKYSIDKETLTCTVFSNNRDDSKFSVFRHRIQVCFSFFIQYEPFFLIIDNKGNSIIVIAVEWGQFVGRIQHFFMGDFESVDLKWILFNSSKKISLSLSF